MFDLPTFTQGLALGLGMFACPGPKDVLVLRQALQRRPSLELLAIGVGSDGLLIVLGMAGVSAALTQMPALRQAAIGLGVMLMAWHGANALWRLVRSSARSTSAPDGTGADGRRALLVTAFLNPLSWLDTVLVIGTTGASLPGLAQPSFLAGAVSASLAWFTTLTWGAGCAARWVESPTAWRLLDAFVALTMLALAAYLALGLW